MKEKQTVFPLLHDSGCSISLSVSLYREQRTDTREYDTNFVLGILNARVFVFRGVDTFVYLVYLTYL